MNCYHLFAQANRLREVFSILSCPRNVCSSNHQEKEKRHDGCSSRRFLELLLAQSDGGKCPSSMDTLRTRAGSGGTRRTGGPLVPLQASFPLGQWDRSGTFSRECSGRTAQAVHCTPGPHRLASRPLNPASEFGNLLGTTWLDA